MAAPLIASLAAAAAALAAAALVFGRDLAVSTGAAALSEELDAPESLRRRLSARTSPWSLATVVNGTSTSGAALLLELELASEIAEAADIAS